MTNRRGVHVICTLFCFINMLLLYKELEMLSLVKYSKNRINN